MRVIEKEMVQAVKAQKDWRKANTRVRVERDGLVEVYLWNNHIADVVDGKVMVNVYTLAKWPTRTTKSRLRALNANI